MTQNALLDPARVRCNAHVTSKKKALELLSELLASGQPALTDEEIFNRLVERERLGSTGLGHGVALPHARVPGLDRAMGTFIKLDEGVDFDAPDRRPADLLFGLLVPEESTDEHLQILAGLAEMFNQDGFCQKCRQMNNDAALFDLLSHQQPPKTATA